MVFYSNNNLRLKLFLLKCRRNTRTENLLDTRVFWTTYNHLQIDCFHFGGSVFVCFETSNLIMLKIIICASNVNHLMILKFLRFKNSMEVFLFIVCNVVIWIFGNAQINFVFIFKKKEKTDWHVRTYAYHMKMSLLPIWSIKTTKIHSNVINGHRMQKERCVKDFFSNQFEIKNNSEYCVRKPLNKLFCCRDHNQSAILGSRLELLRTSSFPLSNCKRCIHLCGLIVYSCWNCLMCVFMFDVWCLLVVYVCGLTLQLIWR